MFSLANVTIGQVSKILHSMSYSKATGLDETPVKYLNDGYSVISKLLNHIINVSITTGCIPDDLKMARLVPMYKKTSKTHICPKIDYYMNSNMISGRLIPLTHV